MSGSNSPPSRLEGYRYPGCLQGHGVSRMAAERHRILGVPTQSWGAVMEPPPQAGTPWLLGTHWAGTGSTCQTGSSRKKPSGKRPPHPRAQSNAPSPPLPLASLFPPLPSSNHHGEAGKWLTWLPWRPNLGLARGGGGGRGRWWGGQGRKAGGLPGTPTRLGTPRHHPAPPQHPANTSLCTPRPQSRRG